MNYAESSEPRSLIQHRQQVEQNEAHSFPKGTFCDYGVAAETKTFSKFLIWIHFCGHENVSHLIIEKNVGSSFVRPTRWHTIAQWFWKLFGLNKWKTNIRDWAFVGCMKLRSVRNYVASSPSNTQHTSPQQNSRARVSRAPTICVFLQSERVKLCRTYDKAIYKTTLA